MKNLRHTFIILLAAISMIVFALYILCFVLNLTVFTEDFFRSYIPKSVLLGMCLLGAIESAILIAENRRWQRRRWQKRKQKGKASQRRQPYHILRRILPHLCIMICGMFIVFYFIDDVNKIMNFIYHGMTEGLLLAGAVMGVLNSLILITDEKRKLRKRKR